MTTLDQYRTAKATYLKLHSQAKQDLIARANDLVAEIAEIQKELREDFGHKWMYPKSGLIRRKPRKPAKISEVSIPAAQINRIRRKLAAQKQKLASPTDPAQSKRIQDRIYELEDELRLAEA